MLFSSSVFSRSLLLYPIVHRYHADRTYGLTRCIHCGYTPGGVRIARHCGLNYAHPRYTSGEYMSKSRYLQTATMLLAALLIPICWTFESAADEPKNRQVDRQPDRSAIRAVLAAQQQAWNRGDIDAFLTGYWHSPDLTFSGSNGISRGWDAVLARYKKNYPDRSAMGTLDFSNLEFRFLGPDAALVLGHWHLKREKDEPGGVFSLVWQRFPEGWRITHDHTSAVADTNPK